MTLRRTKTLFAMSLSLSLAFEGAVPAVYAQTGSETPPEEATTTDLPLPKALQRSEENVLPRVKGPVHLRDDARGKIPEQPQDIDALLTRFFPTWTWVKAPEDIELTRAVHAHSMVWQPEVGACYVGIGFDHQLRTFEQRQREHGGKLPWWEGGADIDIQIRDAQTDALIAEDLSREILAKVRSEEHTSELQSRGHLVCRLLLEKKKSAHLKERHCLVDQCNTGDGDKVGHDLDVDHLRMKQVEPGTVKAAGGRMDGKKRQRAVGR